MYLFIPKVLTNPGLLYKVILAVKNGALSHNTAVPLLAASTDFHSEHEDSSSIPFSAWIL